MKHIETEKEQVTLRLPADLKELLAIEAQNYGVSLNEYVLILIYKARQNQL